MKSNFINKMNENLEAPYYTENTPTLDINAQQSNINPNQHEEIRPKKHFNIPMYNINYQHLEDEESSNIAFKLLQLDNERSTFNGLKIILVIMIFLSLFSLFKSIEMIGFYEDESEYSQFLSFEYLNLLIVLCHISVYLLGFIANDVQRTNIFKYCSFSLVVVDLLYFIAYFKFDAILMSWIMNALFVIFNISIYLEAQRMFIVYTDIEVLKMKRNLLI
jgi:hypothetical protein